MVAKAAAALFACLGMARSASTSDASFATDRVKSPRYVVFYGGDLRDRVILRGPGGDGGYFWASVYAPAKVRLQALKGRPYYSAAVYWDFPPFMRLLTDSTPERLTPENADLLGRFYPAVGDAEPVMVFDGDPKRLPPSLSGSQRPVSDTTVVRRVHTDGLAILERVGVSTRAAGPRTRRD